VLDDVGGRAFVIAEGLCRDLEKIRLGDSVKFRLELRRAGRLRVRYVVAAAGQTARRTVRLRLPRTGTS